MIYNYSISGDFQGGLVNIGQLNNEINASSISTTCNGVNTVDDSLHVNFSSSLSASDITTLDSLISSHVFVETVVYTPIYQLFPRTITFGNIDTYEKICSIIYNGSVDLPLKKISIVSQQDDISGSYCIKVYNSTLNLTIAEVTYTNTEFEINDIVNLTNIPYTNSIIEIQGKKITVAGQYHVENVIFYN